MAISDAIERLVRRIPKVELHVHIEGTLEPEMLFQLAAKHRVRLPYPSIDALRAAYQFDDLQSFLDLYYAGCDVLRDEADFMAMTAAYFRRAHADKVVHAELFFDPQSHTSRGVPLAAVMGGIRRAMREAKVQFGITSELILCFLRHLSEDDAMATLEAAMPFRNEFIGVGLDSSERGHPPAKFARVFAKARELGLRRVAHAGEEGPASYVRDALTSLGAERIDHGVRCVEDEALVAHLAIEGVPLTVCPLSNIKLKVFPSMASHNIERMLRRGLRVTVNSDDPAYFGGYISDNFRAVCDDLPLKPEDIVALCENAAQAAFITPERRAEIMAAIKAAAA